MSEVLPNRMNAVLEFSSRTCLKKLLHRLPVGCVCRLKALAIMKNKSWILIGGVWEGNIRPSSMAVCDMDGLIQVTPFSAAARHGMCSRDLNPVRTSSVHSGFETPFIERSVAPRISLALTHRPHRILTLWSLYGGILREAPTDDVHRSHFQHSTLLAIRLIRCQSRSSSACG
jgi:hypothetical protein